MKASLDTHDGSPALACDVVQIRRSDKLVTIKMPKLANSYSRSDLPELEGFRVRADSAAFPIHLAMLRFVRGASLR